MSTPLPKEIMDKIEEEAVKYANEPHYKGGGKYSASPILYKKIGYRDAALHYSQIIEQKDKEIDRLKEFAKLYDEYIQQKDGFYTRKQYEQRITNCIEQIKKSDTEIEQLKAENERLRESLVEMVRVSPQNYEKNLLEYPVTFGEYFNVFQKAKKIVASYNNNKPTIHQHEMTVEDAQKTYGKNPK